MAETPPENDGHSVRTSTYTKRDNNYRLEAVEYAKTHTISERDENSKLIPFVFVNGERMSPNFELPATPELKKLKSQKSNCQKSQMVMIVTANL